MTEINLSEKTILITGALGAICAVLGHMFPVRLRFRGGKGVATGFGVFLVARRWRRR